MKRLLYIALLILPFGKVLNIPVAEAADKTFIIAPFDGALACLTLACLWHAWKRRGEVKSNSSVIRVTRTFLLWAAGSLVFNIVYFRLNPSESFLSAMYLVRWTECFSFFYATRVLVAADPQSARLLLKLLIAGIIGFCLFGIYQSLFLPDFAFSINPDARPYLDFDPQGHRLVSCFLDPNISAGYILLFGLVIFALYLEGQRGWLWVFGILIVALLMTLSRGGFLGFLVGALIILGGSGKAVRRRVLIPMVILAIAATAVYPFIADQARDSDRFTIGDDSAMMRLVRWGIGISIVEQNPFSGVGFNTLGFTLPHFGLGANGALSFGFDGDLILIAALTGVIGLAFYLNIYRVVFKNGRRILKESRDNFKRGLARGTMAATLGLLVSSFFSQIILFPAIMSCMWTLWGILDATSYRCGQIEQPCVTGRKSVTSSAA